jgi:hypothetical protein
MNCVELAAELDRTLLRQRDRQWIHEARQHAMQCPACARLLELHVVEERLTGLAGIEPSAAFLVTVMDRIARAEPEKDPAFDVERFCGEVLRYPVMLAGALLMALAYVIPSAGHSLLSNLWPATALVRGGGMFAFLAQHPPWAALVLGIAAIPIVLGLAVPEHQVRLAE